MTEQASLTEQIIRPSVEEIHASIPHKGVRDLLNDAKNTYAHDASRFGVGTRSGSSEPRRNGDA